MADLDVPSRVLQAQESAKSFGEAHWFCPAHGDENGAVFDNPDEDDEDFTVAAKQERIKAAVERLKVVRDLFLVLGLGDEEIEQQNNFKQQLNEQLLRCFECNRKYHKSRESFLKQLENEHDDEVAKFFYDALDVLDFERIDQGLLRAKNILENTLSVDRKIKVLMQKDASALLALSEAMCNENYYTNEERLSLYFNDAFNLIQTNKTLTGTEVLPGNTSFLFSPDPVRLKFATKAWESTENISTSSFNWAVRKPLLNKFRSIKSEQNSTQDLERFWAGMVLILNRLDRHLIIEVLKGLNGDIDIRHYLIHCLASCKSEELFSLLTKAYCVIIEKCPSDFYEAFSGASAWSVVEHFLKSPSFKSALSEYNPDENSGATSWCLPFIKSLDLSQQSKACDSLLHHLFEQLQKDEALDDDAKALCFKAGLLALGQTVKSFSADDIVLSGLTIRILIKDLLGLVDKYKFAIFQCAGLQDPAQEELPRLAMMVIRDTIRLDCKVIKAEFDMIQQSEGERELGKTLPVSKINIASDSLPFWELVKDAFTTDNADLARNFLMGMAPLIGLEKFVVKTRDASLPDDMIAFNKSFAELCGIVACLIERLNDFQPKDLRCLIHTPATAYPIYGALVSSNPDISSAMSMVLKNCTDAQTETEALAKLLNENFIQSMTGLCWGIKLAAKSESLAAMPHLLKVGREVLLGLCDTNGGILRARAISQIEEGLAKLFWTTQWNLLKTIFLMLETWSKQPGLLKNEMGDFARDAMDFANELFDEYATLKSACKAPKNDKDVLLTSVVRTMDTMVRWLRLKDTYLATKLHDLICKILRALGNEDIVLDTKSPAFLFIKDVALKAPVIKTNLTEPQRFELKRALDSNQGFEIVEPDRAANKKQRNLEDWSRGADGIKREPSGSRTKSKSSKKIIAELAPNAHAHQTHLDRLKSNAAEAKRKADETKTADGKLFLEKRKKAKEEEERRKAAIVARARGGVSVPGEGSGLRGLGGVQGKDHTPKVESIMVDSETESEDEEGAAEAAALFGGKSKSSFSTIDAERRKAQIQGPVVKTKMVRSAKDMRARLSPNMDPLHQTILNWDFFHHGEIPPDTLECQMIANKFMTAHEYKGTMYPLLVSEAWKDLVTVRDERGNSKSKPFDIKIVSRMSVDNYIEITTSIFYKEMRDQDISDGCIVLLSQGNNPLRDDKAPNCLARVFKVGRNQQNREKMDISYRVSNRIKSKLLNALTPGTEIRGIMLTTMTTLEREFAALHSLEYYDLCDEILNAKPSPILKYNDAAIAPIERNYKVNKAQAKAILSARENDAFTLVQGPPGSGKTKTIVAMVGAILTNVLSSQGNAIARPTPINGGAAPQAVPKKLLICAPSNAAVDEIVSRLKAGVKTMRGDFHKINVLRIGRLSTINSNVQDVSLEKLTNNQLEGSGEENKAMLEEQAKRNKLHEDAGELKQLVSSLRSQLDEARSSGDKERENELRKELDIKRRAQATIGSMIESSKNTGNVVGRNKDIKRRELQQKLINQAHVVCATLSGSGHDMFKNMAVEFETVIIDEAAQCIELSALIPLKYGCSKCILVGDPKQLPPTVLSKMAANYGYEQSLFVRMQQNHPNDIHLLDTQYRMHPAISEFPSQQFYDGNLVDGSDMKALRTQPWHSNSLLGPYRFFDVKGTQQRGQGHSLMNMAEIKVALQLYERVTSDFRGVDWKGKIGIITPYKAQLFQLRLEFQQRYGDAIFDAIEFNTTDAFQGREAEVIIFSCVRAQASGGVGFLNDIRRMNVGLTRAKSSLWVLGDSQSLMQGPFWRKLINDAQERGIYTDGDFVSRLCKPMSDPQFALAPFNRGIPDASAEPATATENRRASAGQTMAAADAEDAEIENSMRRSSIQDVEMVDAPSPSGNGEAPTTSSAAAQATDQPGNFLYAPRGRVFGATCTICGSHAHASVNCDNADMLSKQGGCRRCGVYGHYADNCLKERCLKCGVFGHTDKYCTAIPLGNAAQRKLEDEENRFERARIARTEKRAKRNEGGHNPQIPTIVATIPGLNTPRPISSAQRPVSLAASIPGLNTQRPSLNDNNKRQRPSSPTDDIANKKVPTGPKAMDGRQVPTGPRGIDPSQLPSRPRAMDGSDDRSATLSNRSASAEDSKPASNGSRQGPSMQENLRPPQGPQGLIPVRRKKPANDPFLRRPKPRR